MSEFTLTARYLFPGDQPPIAGGTITVRRGRITAVERNGQRSADQDLGNAAVLPGFVNTHTHLDLSGLHTRTGGLTPRRAPNFIDWLRGVIAHRRDQTDSQIAAAVQFGLQQALQTGTTLIGDISALGQSRATLAKAPIWSVVFYELLGLPIDRARQAWNAAQDWLKQWPLVTRCRPGLSPHAPYSVHRDLMTWAAEVSLPVSIHVAESQDEQSLLETRSGPFVELLRELDVWQPSGLPTGYEDVIHRFLAHRRTLFVHGNYLHADSIMGGNATVVYCPRTHHAFGHSPHPFRRMMQQGVRIALGTDSLASNPNLDMLAEARFLHERFSDVGGTALLQMATNNGAYALGWQDVTGSLTPGKSADMAAVRLPDDEKVDPYDLLWKSSEPVARVMWRGRWL